VNALPTGAVELEVAPPRTARRGLEGSRPIRRARIKRPVSYAWTSITVGIALVLAAPLVALIVQGLEPDLDVWRHLLQTRLPSMLSSTVLLVLFVAVGTLCLGTSLAWLVTAYRFPGRTLMAWLLPMPLAMPAYVLGYLFVSSMDYPGPIYTWARSVFGQDVWFPQVRSILWASFVMTLTLYPYVFLLARAAFREQRAGMLEVARTAGFGPIKTFYKVVLPMARPSLAAGVSLAIMETLTDFATVRLFNVQTLADGVFRIWFGLADRKAATELALVLLGLATVVIVIERSFRRRARYTQQTAGTRGITPVALHGLKAWSATAGSATVALLSLGIPLVWLTSWAFKAVRKGMTSTPVGGFFEHAYHSLFLTAVACTLCLTVAVLVANACRFDDTPLVRASARIASTGYAVPGAVVAVGVVLVLTSFDKAAGSVFPRWTLVTGTLAGLAYAYLVRYMAVGYYSLEASLSKVTPSITWSARTLGAGPRKVLFKIHLPMMRSGAVMAVALVFLDVMKELPATLLLRPFGYDTLAVWIWRMTSDSRWIEASVPSLALVSTCLIPMAVIVWHFERGERPIA
jgi:iron(III) transport system permease protein